MSVDVIPSSEVGLIDKDASRGVLLFALDGTAVPFDVVVTGLTNGRTNQRTNGQTESLSRFMTRIITFACVPFR